MILGEVVKVLPMDRGVVYRCFLVSQDHRACGDVEAMRAGDCEVAERDR